MTDSGFELRNAARNGDYEKVEELLMQNDNIIFDINSMDSLGVTPLHLACEFGHLGVVELLLTHGAYIHRESNDGDTPLLYACAAESVDIARSLFSIGGRVNCRGPYGSTPVYKACDIDNVALVELLLSNGALINCKNKRGNTPLHIACKFGKVAIVELLLNTGAVVKCRNKDGKQSCEVIQGETDSDKNTILNLIQRKSFQYRCQAFTWIRWYKGWKTYSNST
jgi:ankyrin repeat protein